MKEHCNTECADNGRRQMRWTDVSVLILSLLLCACVATVIYMGVQKPAVSSEACASSTKQSETASPPQSVNVNVKVDGEEVSEKISYSEDRNVGVFYESDGSFTAEDYDKGLIITKPANANTCFVIPVGESLDRSKVQSIMSGYHDGDIISGDGGKTVHAQVLPGLIQDTSMFPEEANEKCTDGYMWLTTVDEEADGAFEASIREKRQTSTCTCIASLKLTYTTSWKSSRIHYVLFCIPSCFDSDCTLRHLCI